ncbi:prestalk protein-like [Bradysia coprophila]|uniref:prestalk protein-like n=1 Tax=Bradysia coprophila TaxID=38358 RepID=UPI00187DB054|nr:prestalk protein-like [Bradysia coprophila]
MMDKLNSFVIATFFLYVCYVTSASAITCYSCSDEIACQRPSQYNVTKDCTGACVTIFSGFLPIKKSCVSDLTATETELCNDASNPLCYKCTQANCNNLGRIDHTCLTCSTNNGDTNCLHDPTKIVGTRCPAPTTDEAYCFVTSAGSEATRGCITSTRELQSCSENSLNCSACPVSGTNACNSYPVPTDRIKCVHCSGTNCSTTTSASRYCTDPYDSCVALNNYGNQIQGCAGDMTVNNADFCKNHKHSCNTCNSNDCNRAVPKSPTDYKVCFSCEGITCQRSTLYTQTTDCEKSDTCVTLFENYIPTKKTCYADLSSEEKIKCDTTSNPLCYKCTADRCNSFGRVDHKCLTCSTSTNANCLQNPKSLQTTRCTAPISDDAYCFVKSAGNVVTRGCLNTPHEIASCANDNQQCSFCSVNSNSACNTIEFPSGRRQCHHSRGANPSSLSTSQSKYCAYASDTCLIIKSNGTLSQICSREMNSTEIRICDSNRECCSTCLSNNCNTQIPSYACSTDESHNSSNRNFNSPLFVIIVVSLTITVLMSFSRCVIR